MEKLPDAEGVSQIGDRCRRAGSGAMVRPAMVAAQPHKANNTWLFRRCRYATAHHVRFRWLNSRGHRSRA